MIRSSHLILLTGLLLLAAGCRQFVDPNLEKASSKREAPLVGTDWHLFQMSSLNGSSINSIPRKERFDVFFAEDGTLSGHADCKPFEGRYSIIKDQGLLISGVTWGPLFCGRDSQSNRFLDAVASSYAFELDGTVLRLYYQNQGILTFSAGAQE